MQTKAGAGGGRKLRQHRHALATAQLRAAALAQVPKSQQKAHQALGEVPIHESPNTIGWLEDMEQAALKKRSNERVKYVWAVVFSMPKHVAEVRRTPIICLRTDFATQI